MAERGRPRREGVERFVCPWPGHARRDTVLHGQVKNAAGVATRQRWMCSPGTKKAHTFSVPLDADGKPLIDATLGTGTTARKMDTRRPYVPPEPCPEHPLGTVVRAGRYYTGGGWRQRYLCTPHNWKPGAKRRDDDTKAVAQHRFTGVLPRAHVEGDEACPHCAELRAINRGETAVGRWHSTTTEIAATGLERLGKGESYADIGRWLQTKLRDKGPSAEKKDGYRRAADLVELFAPVVWEDWLTGLARDDEARDSALPRVVMVDDLPIFDKAQKRRRQQQRFAILGLAEVVFNAETGKVKETRLRLLRAFPSHSTEAYTLLFSDLPYVPDFVIADGGKGIEPAVKALAERTGHEVTFITSAYHLREHLRRVIIKARAAKASFTPGDLASRVEAFGPTSSKAAWVKWWRDYERRLTAQGVPRSGWPVKAKGESYQRTIDQLDALAPWPDVPRSTGALEDLFARYVKASIKPRGRGFGNLIRTNQLLDLFVLRANNYFDDHARVVQVLRKDSIEGDPQHPGFAPPVRAITDSGLDRSLLDDSIIAALIKKRGLDIAPAPTRKRAAKRPMKKPRARTTTAKAAAARSRTTTRKVSATGGA
jgi:hypothetical protein